MLVGHRGRRGLLDETGSALLEAIVGIGMLAVLVGSILPFQRAVTDSTLRSAALGAATGAAVEALEVAGLGGPEAVHPTSDDGTRIEVTTMLSPEVVDPCDGPMIGPSERVRVVAAPDRSLSTGGVELLGHRGITVDVDGAAFVRLHVTHTELGGAGVMLVGRDALHEGRAEGRCIVLGPLPPGEYRIAPSDGASLVGATHVPLADLPPPLTMHGSSVDRRVDIALAARLEVVADLGGGRPPDIAGSTDLVWLVRGDDARSVRALGDVGAVHPGRVTAVVSACRNPEAVGSSASLEVVPGEERAVVVPLANVIITNIGPRTDATLLAIRSTACADGTAPRPSLRWSGQLSDGMVLALPHGEWEVRLQTPAGSPLTYPVRMAAGEPGLVVTMP